MKNRYVVFFFFLFLLFNVLAQQKVRIYGYVLDNENKAIELANVYFQHATTIGTTSNKNGYYEITAEIGDSATLVYSMLGYRTIQHTIYASKKILQISVVLPSKVEEIAEITVVGQKRQSSTSEVIDASKYRLIPSPSGGIESFLITFPGVSSHNELSTQYNVRGGSFDENMVYVNGIEIYRPLLLRTAQQEGLSFINQDMVDKVSFSAGGFEAKYGDKMSSVLDVVYKKPRTFESTASVSLLGANVYVGTAHKNFSQMHGVRYKTSAYLLGSLDTEGEYNPDFIDYQTYLRYALHPKWELTFLGNFSQNAFRFLPTTRKTSFGTYDTPRELTVYFQGQEQDLFRTSFGALTAHYKPSDNTQLNFLISGFHTNENENYDIEGEYLLNEVQSNSDVSTTTAPVLAIGKYHEHARNKLHATVASIMHTGVHSSKNNSLAWGMQTQAEIITDKINEWEWRDSAGYSLPLKKDQIALFYNFKSSNVLSTKRTSAHLQNTYKWKTEAGVFSFTGGIRANYWTFNNELLVSPRFLVSLLPNWEQNFGFRFSTGLYYQAPFYKEIRDTTTDSFNNVTTNLNTHIKAQQTIHFVLGGDYYFRAWGRPFKLTTEAYFKRGNKIISYSMDNVRIRYSGENDTKTYTAGIDFKLFGELLPGAESWINFSLMTAKQDILNDSYIVPIYDENGKKISTTQIFPGWMPTPNDQRYSFSLLFQDYLPNNPKYTLQLKCVLSSGLPFGPPRNAQFRSAFRMPTYKRIDIGASRMFFDKKKQSKPIRHIKNIWLQAEVFNLFDFKNVHSYYWITDAYNQQMAVPNYLTGRQLNVKILIDLQ